MLWTVCSYFLRFRNKVLAIKLGDLTLHSFSERLWRRWHSRFRAETEVRGHMSRAEHGLENQLPKVWLAGCVVLGKILISLYLSILM